MARIFIHGFTCLDSRDRKEVRAPYAGRVVATSSKNANIAISVESDELCAAQQLYLDSRNDATKTHLLNLGFTKRQFDWIEKSDKPISTQNFFSRNNAFVDQKTSEGSTFRLDDILFCDGYKVEASCILPLSIAVAISPGAEAIVSRGFWPDFRTSSGRVRRVTPYAATDHAEVRIVLGKPAPSTPGEYLDFVISAPALSVDYGQPSPLHFPQVRQTQMVRPPVEPAPILMQPPKAAEVSVDPDREHFLANAADYFDLDAERLVCAATVKLAAQSRRASILTVHAAAIELLRTSYGLFGPAAQKRMKWTEYAMTERRSYVRAKPVVDSERRICGQHLMSALRAAWVPTTVAPLTVKTTQPTFTAEQETALRSVQRWHAKNNQQVFRLFGYAGTGKSTLINKLPEALKCHNIAYASYTGKGALVLRDKGCANAMTIHRSLYVPFQEHEGADPTYIINPRGRFATADVIVIDECSMVGRKMAQDILSLKKPVLVTGDPGQLPPIEGNGYFMQDKPDVLLQEIHRQARDNPIIELSRLIRKGSFLKSGRYGDTLVTTLNRLPIDEVMTADQILAGRRQTCRTMTAAIRNLRGYDGVLPVAGDKVIAARNDHSRNLLNGESFFVTDVGDTEGNTIKLQMRTANDRRRTFRCYTAPFLHPFDSHPPARELGVNFFEYGHVMSAHRAQGSQWSHVAVFDESEVLKDDYKKWLYSAVTRASDRLTLIRP